MEECIGDVQLVNVPLFTDSKCQEKPNGGGFDKGTEGFVIVDSTFLVEAFGDETSFVTEGSTGKWRLGFIDPFASNDRVMKGSRNKLPCLIL